MNNWLQKITLDKVSKEQLDYFNMFFNPHEIQPSKPPPVHPIHHQASVKKALIVLDWMLANTVALVIKEKANTPFNEAYLATVQEDIITDIPFDCTLLEGALLVQSYNVHMKEFKEMSKEESIFILDPLRTMGLSFNEVLDEIIPPTRTDTYILAKTFNIPYEDWFLATILDQLNDTQQDWMLKHLKSPFVSSLSVQTVIFSARLKPMVMFVEDFSQTIKKFFYHAIMDEIKDFSFGFAYHFLLTD